jgi:hypothetical protein
MGYEMAFGVLRDSLARTEGSSVKQNLASLASAASTVATLGGDAQAVATDTKRLASNEREFKHEMVEFDPVVPDLWKLEGTWTDAFRTGVMSSADRVLAAEKTIRDLDATRSSIVSSRTNLMLQSSLRRLTWFLLALTVALVIIAWATLEATR